MAVRSRDAIFVIALKQKRKKKFSRELLCGAILNINPCYSNKITINNVNNINK